MHVLIIFILIFGLVLARISSPRLNEGLYSGSTEPTGSTEPSEPSGSTGSTEPSELTGSTESTTDGRGGKPKTSDPVTQPPLYSGVW